MQSQTAIAFHGMTLWEEVGRGARSVVYRATRGDEEFAVKIHEGTRDLEATTREFRREAAIHASIRHPAIPTVFEVGVESGKPFIIGELVRGQSLAARLQDGPLPLEQTLKIGLTLSSALAVVHDHGLVHRDIKPLNILIDASDEIKLIDFGLAGQRREGSANQAVGTFRYGAPEQLGLLERPVDGRADLYAVGIVLYECVAGRPPFTSDELSTLLHQHAAVRPIPLDQVEVGCRPALARIVDKLLSKDPDERYPSARALHGDLCRLETLGNQLVVGREVSTGLPSGSEFSIAPVGREVELEKLERELSASMTDGGRVVRVSGPSGSGKTCLIEEFLARHIHADRLVLRGTCAPSDPYPLSPVRGALKTYLTSLKELPSATRDQHLERIRLAAEHWADRLLPLGPELAVVLDVHGSSPMDRDASHLFYRAVATFLARMANLSGGAILWIDNAQWLDDASREALTLIGGQLRSHRLLLILSYRSEEESQRALCELAVALPSDVPPMSLGPLSEFHSDLLISQDLGSRLDPSLVHRLFTLSQGNPLMITQYLQAMKEAGTLVPFWGDWKVDRGALETISLPDNLYALMASRLAFLGGQARQLLAVAAMLGPSIDLSQLMYVAEHDRLEEVQDTISEALAARLIERAAQGEGLTFVHVRIREALLSNLTGDREAFHRRAADYLDARETLVGRDIFERAQHYMLGYGLTKASETFSACVDAAEQAISDCAFGRAHELLSFAEGLEPEVEGTALRLRFHVALGNTAFQLDRIDQATVHFRAALELAVAPVQRAELRGNITRATIFTFNTREGSFELERAFEELGQRLPSAEERDPQKLQARIMNLLLTSLKVTDDPTTFGSADAASAGSFNTQIKLSDTGFLIGYYDRNPLFAMQCGILALEPAWRLGETTHACLGFGTFAFLAGLLRKVELVERFGSLALSIANRLADRQALAIAQSSVGLARHLVGEAESALVLQKEVFERFAGWLGPLSFQNCCVDLAWNYGIRGLTQEELEVARGSIERLRDQESAFMAGYLCRSSAIMMSASATLGQMTVAARYLKDVERLRAIVAPDRAVPWISVSGFLVNYYLQQEDFGPEFEEAVRQHKSWNIPPERDALHSKHYYVFYTYARLEIALRADLKDRAAAIVELREALQELEATTTTPTLNAHRLVLKANLQRLNQDAASAVATLDAARTVAYEDYNPWALFEEALCRARLLRDQHRLDSARMEAEHAVAIATRHHWAPRRRRVVHEFQIEGEFSQHHSEEPGSLGRIDVTTRSGVLRLQLQLDALISLSRASASIVAPDELARIALDESARILGAERAYLFLLDEQQHVLTFQCGRNSSGEDLPPPSEFSRAILERVQDSRRAEILGTSADSRRLESVSVMAYDLRSVMAAPLLLGDRLLGVLYFDNRMVRGVFNNEHVEVLRAICSHMAASLQTARAAQLEAQLQVERERRHLAETLSELNLKLTSTLNLTEGLGRLLEALGRELRFERALVIVRGDESWDVLVSKGFPEGQTPEFYSRPEVLERFGLFNRTTSEGKVANLSVADDVALVLPSMSRSSATEAVVLLRKSGDPFSFDDLALGTTLVDQAGIAIENARLFRRVQAMAELDGLTGLLNRREFFIRAEELVREATQTGRPLGAIMFDIDHFKCFNDTHGHAFGDQVLRAVSNVTREAVRRSDLVGRYGGEEFAILLPDTPCERANEVAERVRQVVERCKLSLAGNGLSVTISVGVTVLVEGDSLERLLSRADKALYQSKAGGRNTVTTLHATDIKPQIEDGQ